MNHALFRAIYTALKVDETFLGYLGLGIHLFLAYKGMKALPANGVV